MARGTSIPLNTITAAVYDATNIVRGSLGFLGRSSPRLLANGALILMARLEPLVQTRRVKPV